MRRGKTAGFTLVEVMVATFISMIVFFAMSTILVKGFSLWRDGASRWYLTQRARVARVRLLNFSYNAGSGMLASSNIVVGTDGSWVTVNYTPQDSTTPLCLYGGSAGSSKKNPYFYRPDNPKRYWFLEFAKKKSSTKPPVRTTEFQASVDTTNEVLTVSYNLHYENGGREYVQPQTITAYLINLNN